MKDIGFSLVVQATFVLLTLIGLAALQAANGRGHGGLVLVVANGLRLLAVGPFMNTAGPLMSASNRAGKHFLDVSAELDTYSEALMLDGRARTAGVMLLPGSGGSVAMLGSLACPLSLPTSPAGAVAASSRSDTRLNGASL